MSLFCFFFQRKKPEFHTSQYYATTVRVSHIFTSAPHDGCPLERILDVTARLGTAVAPMLEEFLGGYLFCLFRGHERGRGLGGGAEVRHSCRGGGHRVVHVAQITFEA